MPGFRLEDAIRTRMEGLRQLCGQNPASAFVMQFDALPLFRDLGGWTAIRPDGMFVFVDDTTGRVVEDLPADLRARALMELKGRYPEVGELLE